MRIISTTLTNSRADVIGKMLEAVVPLVDRCVVIDTGATDDTMRIAEQVCGEKLSRWGIPWTDNFAEARNTAFSIGRSHVPEFEDWADSWILTADTDETLHLPGLREFLATVSPETTIVQVPHVTRQFAHSRLRRATCQGAWREPVHEYLEHAGRAVMGPADWHFECQPRPTEDATAKYRYYARILERGTRAQPKNARRWYYLGDCYAILKLNQSALSAWDHRLKLQAKGLGNRWEAGWTAWRAAVLRHKLGQNAEALATCRTGLAVSPRMNELAWLAGWLCYLRRDYATALLFAERALEIGQPDRSGSFSYPPAQTTLPRDLKRWSEWQLAGKPGEFPLVESGFGSFYSAS